MLSLFKSDKKIEAIKITKATTYYEDIEGYTRMEEQKYMETMIFNASELLYRLREIMPEIGENPVADEMYEIVYKAIEGRTLIEPLRCKDCNYSRPLDRTDPDEDRYSDECQWCNINEKGVLPDEFCSDAYEKEKER